MVSITSPTNVTGTTVGSASVDVHDGWQAADSLLERLAELEPTDPRRARLRDRVICLCVPAARREAARYRRSGETWDDLVQVAIVGLILAVDRFDPGRGVAFKHFAVATLTGELKRHFRDKRWSVRVTRRVQELCQEVRVSEPLLTQILGRMPTDQDLAEHLHITEGDVRAARIGRAAQTAGSLNVVSYDGSRVELHERLGGPDPALDAIADRDALRRALPTLPERLRAIVALRFNEELSQIQIAERMGISQMHVSRLLGRSLAMLRQHMTSDRPVLARA